MGYLCTYTHSDFCYNSTAYNLVTFTFSAIFHLWSQKGLNLRPPDYEEGWNALKYWDLYGVWYEMLQFCYNFSQ